MSSAGNQGAGANMWFSGVWPTKRVNRKGRCRYLKVYEFSFPNWNCEHGGMSFEEESVGDRAHAHILLGLIERLESAVKQVRGGLSGPSPLRSACLDVTKQWLHAQRKQLEDPRPWLAYKRVLSEFERDGDHAHLIPNAVSEWMNICISHRHDVHNACRHIMPLIDRVRDLWHREHLQQQWLKHPFPKDTPLTDHWDGRIAWTPEMLEASDSNPPSRTNSNLAHGVLFHQQAQALPGPSTANITPYAHMPLPVDPSDTQHHEQAAEELHPLHGSNRLEQPAESDDMLAFAAQLVFADSRTLWTQEEKALVDNILKGSLRAQDLEDMLQKAMKSCGFTDRHFWRPRAPGVPMFNEGAVALLRDGLLHDTSSYASDVKAGHCKGLFVVICGGTAVPSDAASTDESAQKASGYRPGVLETTQGNWCCPEGSIEAWVVVQHSQLVRGSLLSPSPDKAGCLQVADLADSSTVQHAVAIALEDRFVSGHARVNVFVSTAFEAAMKTEQATIRDSLHCLIQTLQQQDHQLKMTQTKHRNQFTQHQCRRQHSRAAALFHHLDNIYTGAWHSSTVRPRFVTDECQLPRQQILAALPAVANDNGQRDQAQLFVNKHRSVSDGIKQGLSDIDIHDNIDQGLQVIKAARVMIERQYGAHSNDIICHDSDILARVLMKAKKYAEAAQLLAATVELCKCKYGISSLVTVQCQRNLAQAYLQQYDKVQLQIGAAGGQDVMIDVPATVVDYGEWALPLSKQELILSVAANRLRDTIAGVEFDKHLDHSLEGLAIRAALRFDLAQLYLRDRAIEAKMELEQGLQLAKQYYNACAPNNSCPVDADLHDTMVQFAQHAANCSDFAIASMVLNALAQSSPTSSKRSWTFACMVGLAAVVTAGYSGTLTHMTASLGISQILITCVLLVVIAMGVRG